MMKDKIIATHQPNYIPWMGYFYKISQCDIFVFLDDVQFSKTGAHNYHYIKTPDGLLKLKIPVKHGFIDPINKIITNDNSGWKKRHLDDLRKNYKDAPYFKSVFIEFEKILLEEKTNLAEFNIGIIQFFIKKFGLNTTTIKSSELNLDINLKGENRIIEICKSLDASIYYSGKGARAYQNEVNFKLNNLKLVYDDFSPFKYNQLFGEFISNVSVLDFVFNYGYDWKKYLEMFKQERN